MMIRQISLMMIHTFKMYTVQHYNKNIMYTVQNSMISLSFQWKT